MDDDYDDDDDNDNDENEDDDDNDDFLELLPSLKLSLYYNLLHRQRKKII